jgi:hypothetical protein
MAAAGIGWGLYSLRGRGARDPTAQTAANFVLAVPVAQLTVPVIALSGGLLLLGEVPGWRTVLAAALVLGGVGWSLRPKAA